MKPQTEDAAIAFVKGPAPSGLGDYQAISPADAKALAGFPGVGRHEIDGTCSYQPTAETASSPSMKATNVYIASILVNHRVISGLDSRIHERNTHEEVTPPHKVKSTVL